MSSNTTVFGPASMASGALLPFAGRDLLINSAGLPSGVHDVASDGWLTPEIPVLVRGAAKILPLAWFGEPDRGFNPYAEPGEIQAFASCLQDAGMHRAGPWTLMDLTSAPADSRGSYVRALRESGATKVNSWTYPDGVGIALVWAGQERAGDKSLALHVVPPSWISARAAVDPVAGVDVNWTWADVIRL